MLTVESIIEHEAQKLLEDIRFHSASIGVIKGERSFIQHYGELEIGKGNRPTNSSLYELASVTKTFTASLMAKAVVDGKLKLEDDVRLYLTHPYPNLEFNGQAVTIKHLLTHTSGFPNFPIQGESQERFLEGLAMVEFTAPIGSEYQYSNMAAELSAYILEVVYAQNYDDLLTDSILTPLGMNQTKYVLGADEQKTLIKGYNEKQELMPNFNRTLWGGMAGLYATLPDVLKFMAW